VEWGGEAAKRAQSHGIKVKSGDFLSLSFPDQFFDVVRIWSVLEHVFNPLAMLEKIQGILKPGGYLILQVPNIESLALRIFQERWSGLDLPRHLSHFSPTTLKQALHQTGFQILRLQYSSVGTGFASFHNWLCYQEKQSGSSMRSWFFSRISPFLRIGWLAFDRLCDWFKQGDCLVVWATKKV